MQVRFERGTIATPELLQDIELPSSISVLGQPVDLTNLKVCHKHSYNKQDTQFTDQALSTGFP